MKIKAIETQYKGYRFRSRLEARWAVFFDALKLDWQYEPEGFDLGQAGYYLPDFRVAMPSGLVTWYEVKPDDNIIDTKLSSFDKLITEESGYMQSAIQVNGDPLSMLQNNKFNTDGVGDIFIEGMCPRCGEIGNFSNMIFPDAPDDDILISCFRCDVTTPCGSGNDAQLGILGCISHPHKGWNMIDFDKFVVFEVSILAAAIKARSARFEHGENGARA